MFDGESCSWDRWMQVLKQDMKVVSLLVKQLLCDGHSVEWPAVTAQLILMNRPCSPGTCQVCSVLQRPPCA